ncbi:MAG: PQQ-binding-like beta-propeller repeat protein, partial [candidate division Zixibacteria bacterium]
MIRTVFSISIILFLACADPKIGDNWSTFRGNYFRTGISDDPGPSDNPEIVWELDLGAKSSSSPAISDGFLFYGHETGLVCANVYTGKTLWSFPTPKKIFST